MKSVLKLVCENAFFTAGSNTLNIIGIFEEISSRVFPASYAKMAFVLSLEDCKPSQKILFHPVIKDSTGATILDGSKAPFSSVIGPNGKINLIYNILNLKLPGMGKYTAHLFAGDFEEKVNFEVVQVH